MQMGGWGCSPRRVRGAVAILHGAVVVSPVTLFGVTLDSVLSCPMQVDLALKWFPDLVYFKLCISRTLSPNVWNQDVYIRGQQTCAGTGLGQGLP